MKNTKAMIIRKNTLIHLDAEQTDDLVIIIRTGQQALTLGDKTFVCNPAQINRCKTFASKLAQILLDADKT